MTNEEAMMSNEVEDYSDDLKRETELEARSTLGKTQVAFFDIENMSTTARVFFFVVIFAIFAAILKYFHGELVEKELDVNDVRKEKLRQRKENKKAQ
jgi:hypothetical protein